MAITTTLKLPEQLKSRIARLAKARQQSAHSVMVEALEREIAELRDQFNALKRQFE